MSCLQHACACAGGLGARATRQVAALSAVAVVTAALAAACVPTFAPPLEHTLTVAVRSDVTGFLPNAPVHNERFTLGVNWNVFEGLVRFDTDFKVAPALAESWYNPDASTYVFRLRSGVRFSDGRPLRAEDVVASIEAARARGWVTQDRLHAIRSIEADGPARVVIHTRFPYRLLLYRLPWGIVLPRDVLAQSPVPILGTGPYRVESWRPGEALELARNPHYRGGPPRFARVRFVVAPDAAERIAMLRAGTAQIATEIPPDQVGILSADPGLEVVSGPTHRVLLLVFQVDRPPFSDPRVREAFDLAIDRRELVERVFGGRQHARPATQLVTASVVGYDPDFQPVPPDRDRARRLLEAAGHAAGLRVRLDGPRNRYVRDVEVLHEVARQLALVGVEVSVNALDKRELWALTTRRESSLALTGWACATGEAGTLLEGRLHTRVPGLGSANTSNFSDPVLDELIEKTFRATSAVASRRALQDALARAAELRPLLPLLVQYEAVAASRSVRWMPSLNFTLRLESLQPSPLRSRAAAPPR